MRSQNTGDGQRLAVRCRIGHTKAVTFEPPSPASTGAIVAKIWRLCPLRASYLITDQPQAVIGFLFSSLRRFGGHAQRGESAQLGESDQSGSI